MLIRDPRVIFLKKIFSRISEKQSYWWVCSNIDGLFQPSLFTFYYACAISWQANININCEASLFQREKKQHAMPDTCCAVECQIEILKTFVNDLKDRKSQHKVFCKKYFSSKSFSRICICSVFAVKIF